MILVVKVGSRPPVSTPSSLFLSLMEIKHDRIARGNIAVTLSDLATILSTVYDICFRDVEFGK